jgi:hypothetical protein
MMMAALTGRPPGPSRFDPGAEPEQHLGRHGLNLPERAVERRLSDEFGDLDPDAVRRCVADVSACVVHLGMEPAPALVELIAREHLVGMVKSEPPSGRAPARP